MVLVIFIRISARLLIRSILLILVRVIVLNIHVVRFIPPLLLSVLAVHVGVTSLVEVQVTVLRLSLQIFPSRATEAQRLADSFRDHEAGLGLHGGDSLGGRYFLAVAIAFFVLCESSAVQRLSASFWPTSGCACEQLFHAWLLPAAPGCNSEEMAGPCILQAANVDASMDIPTHEMGYCGSPSLMRQAMAQVIGRGADAET